MQLVVHEYLDEVYALSASDTTNPQVVDFVLDIFYLVDGCDCPQNFDTFDRILAEADVSKMRPNVVAAITMVACMYKSKLPSYADYYARALTVTAPGALRYWAPK